MARKKHRRTTSARTLTLVTTKKRRCKRVLCRAILLPSRRGISPSYMTYLLRAFAPMAGIPQRLLPFWSLPCAHSAVRGGFYTHVPFRLRSDEKSPLQHAATRRHRTQIVFNFPNFGLFISQSNILCEIECQPLRDKAFKTCW